MIEYLAAIFAIVGAFGALSAKHLMRGVLWLGLFFTGIAIFFGLLGAWFLAIGQVFLFIGGVVTLFVLAFNFAKSPTQVSGSLLAGLVSIAVLAALFFLSPGAQASASVSLHQFATFFFLNYGIMLVVAILVLFAAVITAQYIMSEGEQ